MFKTVTIHGLRGLRHLTLNQLQRINLIVGQNNSGKTTVLEGLFLLTNPANAELLIRINAFRKIEEFHENWYALFGQRLSEKLISMEACRSLPSDYQDHLKLEIKPLVSAESKRYVSEEEKTTFQNQDFQSHPLLYRKPMIQGLAIESSSTSNGQTKHTRSELRLGKGLIEVIQGDRGDNVMNAIYLTPGLVESPLVTNLLNNLLLRKETDKLITVLQTALEESVKGVYLGKNNSVLIDVGYDWLMPINSMGAGLVKILALIAATAESRDGVLLIDEIENGLHHRSQLALWKALIAAARQYNVQVFATTHSMECITALSAAYQDSSEVEDVKLYRLEKTEPQTRTVDYDYEIFARAIENAWEVR